MILMLFNETLNLKGLKLNLKFKEKNLYRSILLLAGEKASGLVMDPLMHCFANVLNEIFFSELYPFTRYHPSNESAHCVCTCSFFVVGIDAECVPSNSMQS